MLCGSGLASFLATTSAKMLDSACRLVSGVSTAALRDLKLGPNALTVLLELK